MFDKIKEFTGWDREAIHAMNDILPTRGHHHVISPSGSAYAVESLKYIPINSGSSYEIDQARYLEVDNIREPEYLVGIPEKNTFIHHRVWQGMKQSWHPFPIPNPTTFKEFENIREFGNYDGTFYGYPVISVSGGVVIFVRCEYCHADDHAYHKNLLNEPCCNHCGAPIRRFDERNEI